MPLQFISMPLPSMQLGSFRCLCYAIQGFAKPLRLNANLCNTLAIQLISIHRHCGSNRLCANLRRSQSARILSSPLLCDFTQIHALPLLIRASPHHSLLRHCDSMLASAIALPIWTDLCIAVPLLFNSEHCISLPPHYISMLFAATALQYFAFPQLCFVSPRHAFAAQLKSRHCHAIPLRVCAILHSAAASLFHLYFAIPLQADSILHYAVALLNHAKLYHRRALNAAQIEALPLRYHATLHPCGAYFGVAHRSGPRNMTLAYRFHHDQVWQLPHDGADDVNLVRIRIRVPDSITNLDSISPPVQRRHGPCNISVRQCH